jgi:hypothetical protein
MTYQKALHSHAGVAWRQVMQRSGWHRRPSPLVTAAALGGAAAIVVALAAGGFNLSQGGRPIVSGRQGLTTPSSNRHPASRAEAPSTNQVSTGSLTVPPAAPKVPNAPTAPTGASEPPSTAATPGPSTPTAPPALTTATAPLPLDPAERTAAAFASAYLTFDWSDDADALRLRCRPWDIDELDAALAGPGVPPDRARRTAARETDDV